MAEMKILKAETPEDKLSALEDLDIIIQRRREMESDISQLLELGFQNMVEQFQMNRSLKVPVNMEGMSVSVMKSCYYPLIDAFDQHCYSIGCNDYFPSSTQPFADYCEKGFDAKYVLQAIPQVCQEIKCGVH